MKDERIEQVKNKIGNEMGIIILCGVAVSFLIKILVFNIGVRECMTEYLILTLSPLYQFVRMHTMKVSIYREDENKKSSKVLLIPASIFLIASVLSFSKWLKDPAVYSWQSSAVMPSMFLILSISIFLITNRYDQQRRQKYEKEFDDDNL